MSKNQRISTVVTLVWATTVVVSKQSEMIYLKASIRLVGHWTTCTWVSTSLRLSSMIAKKGMMACQLNSSPVVSCKTDRSKSHQVDSHFLECLYSNHRWAKQYPHNLLWSRLNYLTILDEISTKSRSLKGVASRPQKFCRHNPYHLTYCRSKVIWTNFPTLSGNLQDGERSQDLLKRALKRACRWIWWSLTMAHKMLLKQVERDLFSIHLT